MSNDFIDKIWGKTREVSSSPIYSEHELFVNAGAYCSLHYHLHRSNTFIVHSGVIEIIEFWGPSIKRISLTAGSRYSVPSLVPHLFAVVESGRMNEEYHPDRGGVVDNSDIIRIVDGGLYDDIENLPYTLMFGVFSKVGKY